MAMWYDCGMRNNKNTEPNYNPDYHCGLDAVTTLFWAVPLGLAVAICNGNIVGLSLVAVVVVFGVLIARAD